MKEGYKTSEFWLSLIASVSGLAVALGYLSPDEGGQASNALSQVIGGVVALVSLIQYIKGRSDVKVAFAKLSK